jgi:hypothetical protein
VLWQVADLPGTVIGFVQQGEYQALVMMTGRQRRTMALRAARAAPARARWRLLAETTFAALPDCRQDAPVLLGFVASGRDNGAACLSLFSVEGYNEEVAWPYDGIPHASLHHDSLLLRFEGDDGWHCRLLDLDLTTVADIVLPEAVAPRATVQAGHLLAWDRRGRVVDVVIDTGIVRTLTFG